MLCPASIHRLVMSVLFIATSVCLSAQTDGGTTELEQNRCTWEEFVATYASSYFDDGENSGISEERLDGLRNIYDNPIDINSATREQLLAIPFVSETQADSLISYVNKYGPLLTLGELTLVPRLDYQTRHMLSAFLTCRHPDNTVTIKDMLKAGRHSVAANAVIPFYTPEGYKSGSGLSDSQRYLGDKNRVAARYGYNYANELQYGFSTEKDAGEPFACRGNNFMDSYSFHIFRQQKDGKYTFALGDYRVRFGEGLIVGNMYFSGKKGVLQNYYNNRRTISPHSSYSERDYFRGTAGSCRMKHFVLSSFVSYKGNDAIVNDSSEVTSIPNTGYHRTQTEHSRKGNLHDLTVGGDFSYDTDLLKFGISGTYTHYDKRLNPRQADYNKYAMRGKDFHAYSLHYSIVYKNISARGEGALSETSALAFVNILKWAVTNQTTITSVQRSYSMKYAEPYAEAFKTFSRVNNEQGIYLGATSNVTDNISLCAYADFFRSPWSSYKYRAPLNGRDLYLQGLYHTQSGLSLSAEWKYTHRKCEKINEKTDTLPTNKHLIKLQGKALFGKWSTHSLFAFTSATDNGKTNKGWGASQRLNFNGRKWNASLALSYFNAPNYAARIYMYESNVRYVYNSFVSLYGNGLRSSIVCSAKPCRQLMAYAKFGLTHYFDRNSIGTGDSKVNSSTKSDLSLCIIVTI